ncbi:MAG: DUF4292 domain-containing protein [Bacteroidales bacterium]|nr:DUF4292 domain-containing protein [Bacteroidales bacterium]
MKTFRILLCVAMLALTTVGCRSTQGVSSTPQQAERHDYTVMTFTGTVDGMSVSGQVRMDRDKVIWCSVSKFIEVGRAMATPDSVWVKAPLLGQDRKGNYNDLSRVAKAPLTFADLQGILESDDAERRIEELARRLDITMQVRITRREKVENLSFPFNK